MTQFIRNPAPGVAPENRRRWERSYEAYVQDRAPLEGQSGEDHMLAAAAYADAQWENVVPLAKISGSAAVRVSAVMGTSTKETPKAAVDAVAAWEAKAEREASPDEIRAVLAKEGIDPLLTRAQRTIPGAGLPREVAVENSADPLQTAPAAPAKPRRGRPPKNPGGTPAERSLAAAAPPKPPKTNGRPAAPDPYSERDKHCEKAFKDLRLSAEQIAALLADVPSKFRRQLVELAVEISTMQDRHDELKSYVWSDS